MIKKTLLALAATLMLATGAQATAACPAGTIPITSLVKIFADGDTKANVVTRIDVFSAQETIMIYDFLDKKYETTIARSQQLFMAYRDGFPSAIVSMANNGCAMTPFTIPTAEYKEIMAMLKGV